MSSTAKPKKKARRTGAKEKGRLSLPASTTTIEVGGGAYFVTPVDDMREWLEDVEDILDSRKALEEPGESIPFDRAMAELGIKLPARKKK